MSKPTLSLKPDPVVTVEPAAPAAGLLGTKQWVRVPTGKMLHLYTNVWITTDPKRVEVDEFLLGQIEAGKMVISEE